MGNIFDIIERYEKCKNSCNGVFGKEYECTLKNYRDIVVEEKEKHM